jgi:RNA polymerase sigma-70 factor (ECF subfamily)
VLKVPLRHTRARADAEDAVQETFLKAYWGLQHFPRDTAYFAWLYRVAVNSAKAVLLLRARHSKVFTPRSTNAGKLDDNSAQPKETSAPEELARVVEICRAVSDAIEALADEQRAAIVLREFQGLTYRQVASAMSCPVGTARSRIFRAREAIDARLRHVVDTGFGRPG